MEKLTEEKLKELYRVLGITKKYGHALAILNFDFETSAPKDAREEQGETISYFSNQAFKIYNSKKNKALIVFLHEHAEELCELDKVLINKLYDAYLKEKNVSAAKQLKWSKIYNKAYIDWLEAKATGKFGKFAPSLKKVLKASEEQVSLREDKLQCFYDNLLNDYEEGVLTADLDGFFAELKDGIVEILGKIKRSKHVIRRDFLTRTVPVYKQEEFSRYLLKLNGYNFDKGYLTTTEHPFTSDVAKNDARVTTHYYENAFLSSIFSAIHEGGHAIFMQNEREEDHAHFINDYISNGMHESVSRFYENVIGRSKEYVSLIYPEFKKVFAEEMKDVSERELYEAINIVEPSLIRTEADEVTYGLHIVIRYEMEKALCDGSLKVGQAAKKWNELYSKYLGVKPKSDAEGVLQDVHWTSGFGYFPSYALGNAYNAMYLKEISKDMDFKKAIAEGDFARINGWMKNRVFRLANVLKPKEWLFELTGKKLTAKDFLQYLNEKYGEIYGF